MKDNVLQWNESRVDKPIDSYRFIEGVDGTIYRRYSLDEWVRRTDRTKDDSETPVDTDDVNGR